MTRTVGIDDLGAHTPPYSLALADLAQARGVPPEKITVGLGAHHMSVTPPWEDAVTLGANAARRVFATGAVDPDEIGMLLVATETAVDHAKPVGIFLHELLGLPSRCRTVELKHACYAGTAGLMLAAEWVRSGAARGRKALVVATDIARYDLHSSAEFTQGAGAVALVVSEAPRLLEIDPATGIFAKNVYDFWRPLDRREALVDGKFSIDCYLDALEAALGDWATVAAPGAPLHEETTALLYHAPFPKMAHKAHARLMATEWRRASRPEGDLAIRTAETYASHVDLSLGASRLVGNTYTASLYFCLAWLAEHRFDSLAGHRIGLFSYGSGCCAEFFTGRFTDTCEQRAAGLGLADMLRARRALTVAEYERFVRPSAVIEPPEDAVPAIRFLGVRGDKRVYENTEARP